MGKNFDWAKFLLKTRHQDDFWLKFNNGEQFKEKGKRNSSNEEKCKKIKRFWEVNWFALALKLK